MNDFDDPSATGVRSLFLDPDALPPAEPISSAAMDASRGGAVAPTDVHLGELQSPRVPRLGELLAVLLLNVQLTMSSRRMNLVLFLVDQLPRNVLVRQLNSRLCCDLFAFSLSVKKPHILLKIELFLNL